MLDLIGKIIGVLIKLLKVAIVISIIQGFITGDWSNLILSCVLVAFIVLTSRYASNMIAYFSTFVPFVGELFNVDSGLRAKGEKFKENGFNVFDRND